MFKLFRRFRKKLLDSGSATKYLLYAFGEILLVVVGILIALQVNNWNEEQIDRRQEVKILMQIGTDLQTTKAKLEDLQSKLQISNSSADSLLKSFREGVESDGFVFHASLIHRRFFFNPASSGYLQLSGILGTVIRSEELRNQVTALYEEDFEDIVKRQDLLTDHLNQNLIPLSSTLFDLNKRISFRMTDFDENSMDFYSPIVFDELSQNTEYANLIVIQKRLYIIQLNQLQQSLKRIEEIADLIEGELEMLPT